MNKQIRMMIKIIIIIFCIILLKIVYDKGKDLMIAQPAGVYVRVQDVMILSAALRPEITQSSIYLLLEAQYQKDGEALLTYGDFLALTAEMEVNAGDRILTGYRREHLLLKSDWQQSFSEMRLYYEAPDRLASGIPIEEVTVTLAGLEERVADNKGDTLTSNQLLTAAGEVYFFASDEFRNYDYQTIEVLSQNGVLLTVNGVIATESILPNVLVLAADETGLTYFYRDHEVKVNSADSDIAAAAYAEEVFEQLADLHFEGGRFGNIKVKNDKISGKLLAITADSLTLEGQGSFPLEPDMPVYRYYDSLQNLSVKDLTVGYDFTDFVVSDGKICGALITRKEAMEYIRVIIKTQDFTGTGHAQVKLTADTDYKLTYGPYDQRNSLDFEAGEELVLKPDSDFLQEGNVIISPVVNTGKITLLSLKRNQGTPSYRGSMEISRSGEGLLLVNEVLLEEYLYSVVPSEMPAGYPLEALKAQAICARTYAYRYLLNSDLGALGAHVDDSVQYQVYNNVAENSNTTKAVKETTGRMLYYGDAPADTYYYSTSCGYGTTSAVWSHGGADDISYLQAAVIGRKEEPSPEELTDEDTFREFIQGVRDDDYEKDEPWYRWSVAAEKLDRAAIGRNLVKRYGSNPDQILTLADGEYTSRSLKEIGEITDIYSARRLPGGVMDELVIVTKKDTYKVISENAIRFVMNDGKARVLRQDGSEAPPSSLLPSAFMTISLTRKNGVVTGYTLTGGGYGHGVGMSQNGARALGLAGSLCNEILDCFYQSCEVRTVY